MRRKLGDRVHFWPFDGWTIPANRSVLVEAYPRLWNHAFPREDRTGDQHDAYTVTAWLQQSDRNGSLQAALNPELTPPERTIAKVEGWIIGVG